MAGADAAACAAKPIRTVDHWRHLTHRVIADLEATGMVLRRGTTALRNGTGGLRRFADRLGTQVVRISGQAAARTGLRHHEAAAAGFDPATAEWVADDHKAYHSGGRRTTLRVTGDRATGRLPGMQSSGNKRAEIIKRIGIAASAIYGTVTVDPVSDLDLSYTPPLASPRESARMRRTGLAPGYPAALTRSGH
jgi:NADPH-dependent 2,4-dienoyl-CoA reductase/sulfur reductase-like enzyme